jgi:hypothetical protein
MREWTIRMKIPATARGDLLTLDPIKSAEIEWDPFVIVPEAWSAFW